MRYNDARELFMSETIAQKEINRLEERLLEVGDAIGAFIEWWGFKRIHGRIWTLLALSQKPIPQTEVADILKVSRSLVSQAMSDLIQFGLVRPISDHRNAPFTARFDVWSTIAGILRKREWMLIEEVRLALIALIAEAEVSKNTPNSLNVDLRKIKLMLKMTDVAQSALQIIISIASAKMPSGLTSWMKKAIRIAADLRTTG